MLRLRRVRRRTLLNPFEPSPRLTPDESKNRILPGTGSRPMAIASCCSSVQDELIGASGAAFGLLLAFATILPDQVFMLTGDTR